LSPRFWRLGWLTSAGVGSATGREFANTVARSLEAVCPERETGTLSSSVDFLGIERFFTVFVEALDDCFRLFFTAATFSGVAETSGVGWGEGAGVIGLDCATAGRDDTFSTGLVSIAALSGVAAALAETFCTTSGVGIAHPEGAVALLTQPRSEKGAAKARFSSAE
jgi:hypothetical protein